MTTTQEAADAYVDWVRQAFSDPAYNVPHARDDLRQIEAAARELWNTADKLIGLSKNLTFGNEAGAFASQKAVAIHLAETLEGQWTDNAMSVLYAEIEELAKGDAS